MQNHRSFLPRDRTATGVKNVKFFSFYSVNTLPKLCSYALTWFNKSCMVGRYQVKDDLRTRLSKGTTPLVVDAAGTRYIE